MPITSLTSKQYVGTTASSPPPSAVRSVRPSDSTLDQGPHDGKRHAARARAATRGSRHERRAPPRPHGAAVSRLTHDHRHTEAVIGQSSERENVQPARRGSLSPRRPCRRPYPTPPRFLPSDMAFRALSTSLSALCGPRHASRGVKHPILRSLKIHIHICW